MMNEMTKALGILNRNPDDKDAAERFLGVLESLRARVRELSRVDPLEKLIERVDGGLRRYQVDPWFRWYDLHLAALAYSMILVCFDGAGARRPSAPPGTCAGRTV